MSVFILQLFSTSYGKKTTLLPYRVKKHHSTLEMDNFKACYFFLISLRLIINLAHPFKSPFLDIKITIKSDGTYSEVVRFITKKFRNTCPSEDDVASVAVSIASLIPVSTIKLTELGILSKWVLKM